MAADRPYVQENQRQLERLRALVSRLTDEDLRRPVNEHWTVAAVLGHMAYWDAWVLGLADKLERGVPFVAGDVEPEDVSAINDAARPLIHAIPPREAARVTLALAEETDRRVAALPPERLWPADPESPINPLRADHRAEHLDEIETALGG